ncbi:hypothetical protein P3L10_003863 [Capsicum annuum]
MGKTMQMGHFRAKSVCYSLRFCGWPRGPGVLQVENRLGHAREVGDCPSMVHLIFCGLLDGQTCETARTGYFWAKSVYYSSRFHGWAWGPGVL